MLEVVKAEIIPHSKTYVYFCFKDAKHVSLAHLIAGTIHKTKDMAIITDINVSNCDIDSKKAITKIFEKVKKDYNCLISVRDMKNLHLYRDNGFCENVIPDKSGIEMMWAKEGSRYYKEFLSLKEEK